MSKNSVLAVVGLSMVLAALTANHALGQLQTAVLRRLPVESFPNTVGSWTCISERTMDERVAKIIPTAHQIDRDYQDAKGHQVNFLLLTATDYADFHDPNICFPGQGYTLSDEQTISVEGHNARTMTAERSGNRLRVIYWWNGSASIDTKYGRNQMGKLLALRDRLTSQHGQSLFVRLITPDGPDAAETLKTFIEQSAPAVQTIETDTNPTK